ncbi:uncharacterized protein LOC128955198 [Oppia nitens]|uniref:uncharacterized protein LOC128955198 n=1 Tax=Oppia nitens TaxID=1686743 RepID=UPI0023DC6D6B|nr:uncharacterized protein LOC128955198 [Oppia nitens]
MIVLRVLLWTQLSALIVRQSLDFCGVQWLSVFVNFVAILVTIAALFGHLVLHALFQLPLIVYNCFVCLLYSRFPEALPVLALADPQSQSALHSLLAGQTAVRVAESVQAVSHLAISAALMAALFHRFRRHRSRRKHRNSKTTPPLPPYTISPLAPSLLPPPPSSLSRSSQRSRRSSATTRSSKRRSQRRKQRLLTTSAFYSDSETDFYGVTNASFTPSAASSNPLYDTRNRWNGRQSTAETRI